MLCILWHIPEVIFGSLHCLVAWSPLARAFLAWLLSVLFLKMADVQTVCNIHVPKIYTSD